MQHAKCTNKLFFSNLLQESIISQKLRLFIPIKIRLKVLMALNVKSGVSDGTPRHLVDQLRCFWRSSCITFRAFILQTVIMVKQISWFSSFLYTEVQEFSWTTWPWRWRLQSSITLLTTYHFTQHNIAEDSHYIILLMWVEQKIVATMLSNVQNGFKATISHHVAWKPCCGCKISVSHLYDGWKCKNKPLP